MKVQRPIYLTILCWVHVLLLFWCVYPLVMSYSDSLYNHLFVLTLPGLLLLIPIVSAWLLLPYFKKFLIYFLVGVGITALTAYLSWLVAGPQEQDKKMIVTMTVIFSLIVFALHTYTKRQYGKARQEYLAVHDTLDGFPLLEREMPCVIVNPQPWQLVWFVVVYALSLLIGQTEGLGIMFAMTWADVLVLVVYWYGSSFYEYVRRKSSSSGLPMHGMRRIHRLCGVVGGIVLLLFMLPSAIYGKAFSLDTSARALHLGTDTTEAGTEILMSANYGNPINYSNIDPTPTTPAPDWFYLLFRVLGVAMLVAAGIALVIVLFQMVRHFQHEFAEDEDDEVVSLEEIEGDVEKRLSKRVRAEGVLSPNQQIRRRYRRTIRKALGHRPKRSGTPTEIENEADVAQEPGMVRLHGYYERARYSFEGCTQEDVRALRE